jgi:hypothetical protein
VADDIKYQLTSASMKKDDYFRIINYQMSPHSNDSTTNQEKQFSVMGTSDEESQKAYDSSQYVNSRESTAIGSVASIATSYSGGRISVKNPSTFYNASLQAS